MSRLDVVVFGGSGFTGRHAAAALARRAPPRGLQWGLAGRSPDKLHAVLADISQETGQDLSGVRVIVADVQDEQSLRAMCGQAKVLVNCCGTYVLYGEPVIKAAIHSGTHYVDLCADPYFIQLMQLKYDQESRRAGVYVVNACGFGSIPTDLGVLYLQENFAGILNSVECYMSLDNHYRTINHGSWISVIYGMSHYFKLQSIQKQLYPTLLPELKPELKSRLPIHKRFNGWCMWLPGNDSSAVYRTQRYFYEQGGRRPAQIKTYIKFESLLNTLIIIFVLIFTFVMSHFEVTRQFVLKYSNFFTGGTVTDKPSEEVIQNKGFCFTLCGVGWDRNDEDYVDIVPPNKSMILKVSGKNPGYGLSVDGVLYAALAILEERDQMPPECGVLSPGIAFSKTRLVQNLQDSGIKFEIVCHEGSVY